MIGLRICLLVILMASTPSYAQWAVVGPAVITFVENGWFGEGIAIRIEPNAAVPGCGPDFGVRSEHPAYKQITALIIGAYHTKSRVELVIDPGACVFGNRTSITSVRLVQ